MNKYEIINAITVSVDALADAHGIDKCTLIVQVLQLVGELKKILQAEDEERGRAE